MRQLSARTSSERPFPETLPEFRATFPDDAACRRYLVESRWPDGFRCPSCGGREAWTRNRALFICRRCRTETSVTAGTVLDHTHLPLATWFRAAYLVASTPGLSALALGRQLGLTSRKTAATMMSRFRRSMSSLALPPLSGVVEADETVVGGDALGARGFAVAGTNQPIVLVAGAVRGDRRSGRFDPRAVADTVGRSRLDDHHRRAQRLRRIAPSWLHVATHPAPAWRSDARRGAGDASSGCGDQPLQALAPSDLP